MFKVMLHFYCGKFCHFTERTTNEVRMGHFGYGIPLISRQQACWGCQRRLFVDPIYHLPGTSCSWDLFIGVQLDFASSVTPSFSSSFDIIIIAWHFHGLILLLTLTETRHVKVFVLGVESEKAMCGQGLNTYHFLFTFFGRRFSCNQVGNC